jgi:hypothetical protein
VRANLPLFERPAACARAIASPATSGTPLRLGAAAAASPCSACRTTTFNEDADRIARAFLSMVVEDFERRGPSSRSTTSIGARPAVEGGIHFGYAENQSASGGPTGFFWSSSTACGGKVTEIAR